jgi:hypothetical protein
MDSAGTRDRRSAAARFGSKLGKWEVQPRRENLMTMRTLERQVTEPVDDDLGRARSALLRSNIYVLRKLQVDREGERLVLRGRVESF